MRTEEHIGRILDGEFGLVPLRAKAKPPEPKEFPARALRSRPGEAPIIEQPDGKAR